jgi:hypothetical protein
LGFADRATKHDHNGNVAMGLGALVAALGEDRGPGRCVVVGRGHRGRCWQVVQDPRDHDTHDGDCNRRDRNIDNDASDDHNDTCRHDNDGADASDHRGAATSDAASTAAANRGAEPTGAARAKRCSSGCVLFSGRRHRRNG